MRAVTTVQAGEEADVNMREMDFEALVSSEQRRIFALCLRLLRNRDEADSATQDVFVEAYREMGRGSRPPIQEPAKWLTRVALNTCYDRIRSKRWRFWQRHSAHSDDVDRLRSVAASGPDQEDKIRARDISQRLESALERLSARQRTVFILRHDEDRSIEEIASIMGLDTGTIKAHMARAVKKLREELRDLYAR